jgi:hypothetical protein
MRAALRGHHRAERLIRDYRGEQGGQRGPHRHLRADRGQPPGRDAFDVNVSALYSVYKTLTGSLVIPAQPNSSAWNDGILVLSAHVSDPCGALNSCNITLTDSLGSSVTLTLPPAKY